MGVQSHLLPGRAQVSQTLVHDAVVTHSSDEQGSKQRLNEAEKSIITNDVVN